LSKNRARLVRQLILNILAITRQ